MLYITKSDKEPAMSFVPTQMMTDQEIDNTDKAYHNNTLKFFDMANSRFVYGDNVPLQLLIQRQDGHLSSSKLLLH